MEMEKVHLLQWSSSCRTYAAYSNHGKACRDAEELNKKRSWIDRLMKEKWVVKTFDVKN